MAPRSTNHPGSHSPKIDSRREAFLVGLLHQHLDAGAKQGLLREWFGVKIAGLVALRGRAEVSNDPSPLIHTLTQALHGFEEILVRRTKVDKPHVKSDAISGTFVLSHEDMISTEISLLLNIFSMLDLLTEKMQLVVDRQSVKRIHQDGVRGNAEVLSAQIQNFVMRDARDESEKTTLQKDLDRQNAVFADAQEHIDSDEKRLEILGR